ncbi:Myosin-13 [Rhizoctonia solani]|uniref:Myosin-13 n=1 Tax=Rhizoctonia solani TaxID=456999 RepID=A0A0K6FLW9_9AGAM|nr:Myosin-13 [Rhizoctonia solani]
MAEQLQVPFELPRARPGFPIPPQPPASIDQITWAYLAESLAYYSKLHSLQLNGHGLVEPQMLAETKLHNIWVATYLVNQKRPLPSINLPAAPPAPPAPLGDLQTLITNGFRDVGNKLDSLTNDVKKLQTDSVATNKKLEQLQADSIKTNEKLDGLTTDVKKLQTDSVATNKKLEQLQADSIKTNEKLDGLTTDVKKLQTDSVATNKKLEQLQADNIKTNEKLDGLTTNVKKLQADSVKTEEKLDGLTTDVKKLQTDSVATNKKLEQLQADSIKTNEKLDGLTTDVKKLQADSVKAEEKLDGLTTNTNKLHNSVNALGTAFDKIGVDFNLLKQSVGDNEAGLRALNRTITDLPTSEGFRQAVSASITENERIIEIGNTVNGHSETLDRMSTNTAESLARLQRRVDGVDRFQSQVFNASRKSNESWLPIRNKDGVFPSEQNLVVVRSRNHLNSLENRQIAQLLAFYDCFPSDFPAANTLAARTANFMRQSRHWTADARGIHIGALGDILANPSVLPWHNEGND